jgi:hypothetical protein
MSKASEAILDVLRDMKATPEATVETFEVGIPLVLEKGFSQDDVVNGLIWLQSEKVIELLGGNRLRLVKPLPEAP